MKYGRSEVSASVSLHEEGSISTCGFRTKTQGRNQGELKIKEAGGDNVHPTLWLHHGGKTAGGRRCVVDSMGPAQSLWRGTLGTCLALRR